MITFDPLPGFRYFVTLDPADMFLPVSQASLLPLVMAAGFQEVTGLQGELEVETYAEGGVNDTVHQLPVRHSWGRITLKRGIVQDGGLFAWYKAGLTGVLGARRSGAIILMTPRGLPAMAWEWKKGLAAKWTGPEFNALQSAIALESLEIAHEGLDQITLPALEGLDAVVSLAAGALGALG
jgi:phage tail-like protein